MVELSKTVVAEINILDYYDTPKGTRFRHEDGFIIEDSDDIQDLLERADRLLLPNREVEVVFYDEESEWAYTPYRVSKDGTKYISGTGEEIAQIVNSQIGC